MAHSFHFGPFQGDLKIGYTRLVSDHVAFGYLLDVFIAEQHRGKGHGKWFMGHLPSHPDVEKRATIGLAALDAKGLYAEFGSTPTVHPERMMERKRK